MGLPRHWAAIMNATKDHLSFLKPLRSISPTTFSTIKKCALKVVWQRNGSPPLLPTSPKTRVGTVAHKLLAEAGQGRLKATADSVNARWRELLEEASAEISHSLLERHLSPLESSVPDIEVLRIRTTRMALDIARESQPTPRKDRSHVIPPSYGHEILVQSADSLVRGKIDAVIREDGTGPIIQDYKSGSIMELEDGNELHPKEDYQTQMKMYAGLYAENFGEWPASLELVSLTGERQGVPFAKNDCSNLLDEAKATLRRINETVENHPSSSLPSILASPSPETCVFCEFRPGCEPYLLMVEKQGEERWPIDVIGTVESVKRLGNSKMMLSLATGTDSVKIPGLSSGDRHPALMALQPGDMAGVFNLRRSRPTAPYSESRLTTVHNLRQTAESGQRSLHDSVRPN